MTSSSTSKYFDRFRCLLENRRLPLWLALAAILFTLPAIWTGYYQDDHLIRVRFQGFPHLPGIHGSVLDTCVFGDGNPEQNHARMERGMLPWWTPEHWKIAFWRPLCAATHWLEWQVFGDRAWIMHAQNLLWYAALIFVVTLLYRRFLVPPWAAGLAALLYMLDASHAFPVCWIATRNAPMSSVFIVLVIYFHDRWRRDGWRPGAPLALLMLTLGLFACEATIAAGAYLAAYALFMDRAAWLRRWAALMPYLAIVALWKLLYDALGYGVAGTLLYTDPIHAPVQFAFDLIRGIPVMLFCQFGATDPVVFAFLPGRGQLMYLAIALVFLACVAWAIAPLLRRDAGVRFWLTGTVLSMVPVLTTFPQGRELMNPGIGAMAVVAQFIAWRWTCGTVEGESRAYRRMARTLVAVWIVLHLFVSAIALPIASGTTAPQAERVAKRLNAGAPSDPGIVNDTLVVAYLPADLLGATLPIMRAADGEPVPKHYRQLCAGVQSLDIERKDERTLVYRFDDTFMTRPFSQIFRDPEACPMRAGDTISLTGMTARVLTASHDGRPKEVEFRFDKPLEDPSLRWVICTGGVYVPFTPPAVGTTLHIEGPSLLEIARILAG